MRPIQHPDATGRPVGAWLSADDLAAAVEALEIAHTACEEHAREEGRSCSHPDFAALAARLAEAAPVVPAAQPGSITTPQVAAARGHALMRAYEAICGGFADPLEAFVSAAADLLHAASAATKARPGEVMSRAMVHTHEEITGRWCGADATGYMSMWVSGPDAVEQAEDGQADAVPLLVEAVRVDQVRTWLGSAETTGPPSVRGQHDHATDFPGGALGAELRSLWLQAMTGGPVETWAPSVTAHTGTDDIPDDSADDASLPEAR